MKFFLIIVAISGCAGIPALAQSAGGAGTPSPKVGADAPEVGQVLRQLVTKAKGGDSTGAGDLVDRLLGFGRIAMDEKFREEVEKASPAEAARILGVTLLRVQDPEMQAEGVGWVEKAAEAESALGMELLAQILLEGKFGKTIDVPRAVELLKAARQLPGTEQADRILGDLAMSGTGMPKDAAIAMEYYRKGADAGQVSSLLALHRLFRDGREFPADPVLAETYGRAAADTGDAEAAWEMALFFEKYSASAPEWLRSSEWLATAAERGNLTAYLRLSEYAFEGRPGAANPDEGVRWLRVAAGKGSAEACARIANAYREGKVLPEDPVASTAWFRVAAELGHAGAANLYGLALVTGFGTSSQPAEAVRWFESSARGGFSDAKINLGELHWRGVGLPKNVKEARRLFEEAAKAGSAAGAEKLARLLEESGEGAQDRIEAAIWAARAVERGSGSAKELFEKIQAGLSATEREAVGAGLATP